jgi:acyl-CoA thioesterase-1
MHKFLRLLLASLSVTVSVTFLAAAAQAAPKIPPSILVFGDSLSSAYGIAERRGWVALLEERLKRDQLAWGVVNASISGETTSGGRSRLGRALEEHRPAVVVIELGGNDGLRGLPIAEMKKNLAAMIEQSQKSGARVLLVATRMPPNYGPDYTQAFDGAFAELAKRHRAALVPYLFEGFGEKIELFQPDRIHPTEAAQPLILQNVWPALRPLLK